MFWHCACGMRHAWHVHACVCVARSLCAAAFIVGTRGAARVNICALLLPPLRYARMARWCARTRASKRARLTARASLPCALVRVYAACVAYVPRANHHHGESFIALYISYIFYALCAAVLRCAHCFFVVYKLILPHFYYHILLCACTHHTYHFAFHRAFNIGKRKRTTVTTSLIPSLPSIRPSPTFDHSPPLPPLSIMTMTTGNDNKF